MVHRDTCMHELSGKERELERMTTFSISQFNLWKTDMKSPFLFMSTSGGNLTWQISSSWWAESSKMAFNHAVIVLIRWPVSGTTCLQWLTVGWTLAWPGYTAGCSLWVVRHLGRTCEFFRVSKDWTLSLTRGRKWLRLVQVRGRDIRRTRKA